MFYKENRLKIVSQLVYNNDAKFYHYLNLKELKVLLIYYKKIKDKKVLRSELKTPFCNFIEIMLAFILILMTFLYMNNLSSTYWIGAIAGTLLLLMPRILIKKGIKEFFDKELSSQDLDILLYYMKGKLVKNEKEKIVKKTSPEKTLSPAKKRL